MMQEKNATWKRDTACLAKFLISTSAVDYMLLYPLAQTVFFFLEV